MQFEILSHADIASIASEKYFLVRNATSADGSNVFEFNVEGRPLMRLIEDAQRGLRIYELFSITRPGDLYHYLLVHIPEKAVALKTYSAGRYKASDEAFWKQELGPDDLNLVKFDKFFVFDGDDTDGEYYHWLEFRDSYQWRSHTIQLLNLIQAAKENLKKCDDYLLQQEFARFESHNHHCDF